MLNEILDTLYGIVPHFDVLGSVVRASALLSIIITIFSLCGFTFLKKFIFANVFTKFVIYAKMLNVYIKF